MIWCVHIIYVMHFLLKFTHLDSLPAVKVAVMVVKQKLEVLSVLEYSAEHLDVAKLDVAVLVVPAVK